MTNNIPLGDTGYEIEKARIETVRNGDILIFDYGSGPQRFVVDAIAFKSKQESPGKFVNTYTPIR